jgi:hypothetical protein
MPNKLAFILPSKSAHSTNSKLWPDTQENNISVQDTEIITSVNKGLLTANLLSLP